ncbi:uncharacterized protein VTP21DRAFT_7582 [Calcarisporiella thermophila]|uniref:uncharacterized protein n=1 Tax=Calcarisporiella thermophila TaxID=911321 RepID=UPI003742FFE9
MNIAGRRQRQSSGPVRRGSPVITCQPTQRRAPLEYCLAVRASSCERLSQKGKIGERHIVPRGRFHAQILIQRAIFQCKPKPPSARLLASLQPRIFHRSRLFWSSSCPLGVFAATLVFRNGEYLPLPPAKGRRDSPERSERLSPRAQTGHRKPLDAVRSTIPQLGQSILQWVQPVLLGLRSSTLSTL